MHKSLHKTGKNKVYLLFQPVYKVEIINLCVARGNSRALNIGIPYLAMHYKRKKAFLLWWREKKWEQEWWNFLRCYCNDLIIFTVYNTVTILFHCLQYCSLFTILLTFVLVCIKIWKDRIERNEWIRAVIFNNINIS